MIRLLGWLKHCKTSCILSWRQFLDDAAFTLSLLHSCFLDGFIHNKNNHNYDGKSHQEEPQSKQRLYLGDQFCRLVTGCDSG